MKEKLKYPKIRFSEFTSGWIKSNLEEKVDFFSGLTYSPSNVVKKDGQTVPEIRFNGFEGDWEKVKLSKASNISTGFPFDSCEFSLEGQYLVITNSNIQHESNIVDGKIGNRIDISDNLLDYVLDSDDILITMDGTVGRTAKVIEPNQILAQRVGRLKSIIDSEFLYQHLNTGKFFSEMTLLSTGGTIKHISLSDISNYLIQIPTSTNEQMKIGRYFKNLDSLISNHQKKHKRLVTLKKSMLEKMFPKDGQTVPEIRFNGFEGDWEKVKLSKASNISTGFPFDSCEFSLEGQYLVITNSNIQHESNIVDGKIGNRIDISDNLLDYVLDSDDILITMDGTVGRTAKVIEPNQILAQRVGRLKSIIDSEFLYQHLNTGKFFSEMTLLSTGGTIKHISLSDISNYLIQIPTSTNEQMKIGRYFKNLDSLISNHQNQLQKLKNLKLSLSDKMFV